MLPERCKTDRLVAGQASDAPQSVYRVERRRQETGQEAGERRWSKCSVVDTLPAAVAGRVHM